MTHIPTFGPNAIDSSITPCLIHHSDSISKMKLSNLNPLAEIFISVRNDDPVSLAFEVRTTIFIAFMLILSSYIVSAININTYVPKSSGVGLNINPQEAMNILREIRVRNVNKVIIGTLNINSLPPKFEQLMLIIGNCIDILVIQETKLDPSFPDEQFVINGYTQPYRLDRNRNGGGVIIYVREDIPSKKLDKHIEGLFVEVN